MIRERAISSVYYSHMSDSVQQIKDRLSILDVISLEIGLT
jgi:hypothetical protein